MIRSLGLLLVCGTFGSLNLFRNKSKFQTKFTTLRCIVARRLNRIWKSFFVVLGIGLLLTGAAAFVLYPQILKPPPKADYSAAQSTEEANLQDIDYLGRLIEIDRSFGPEAKAAFIAGVA